MKVTVVIITKNEVTALPLLFSALRAQTYLPDEVVVIDDYSHDGTWEWLQSEQAHVVFPLTIIQSVTNRSQARNLGVQKASYSVIAMTDAGCIPHRTWLKELVQILLDDTQPSIIAGWTVGAAESAFEAAEVPYVLPALDRVDSSHFLPTTRSVLFTKSAWELVGGFDERLNEAEDYAFFRAAAQHPQVNMRTNFRAVVAWRPRATIFEFSTMIHLYAQGDARAGSFRPKVLTVYGRYCLWVCLWLVPYGSVVAGVLLIGYALWAVWKNGRYAGGGWVWLPLLQIVSDIAVMMGTMKGLLSRYLKLF